MDINNMADQFVRAGHTQSRAIRRRQQQLNDRSVSCNTVLTCKIEHVCMNLQVLTSVLSIEDQGSCGGGGGLNQGGG